jgi:hypothetical protein
MPTNVNIQNGTDTSLSLETTVTPTLGSDYWGIDTNTAPGGQKTAILWMDRDIGITDGDTWVFTTSFVFDGVDIQLLESLTGTAVSSDIKLRIVAGAHDSGWSEESTSVEFSGGDGIGYQINGTFFLNGTYDDVTYSLIAI